MSDVTITPDTTYYYPYSTIQTYTITTSGEYQITSIGGNGGGSIGMLGGVGTTVVADFSLNAGDVIEVIPGSGGGAQSNAGGGGGGSFVYDETTGALLEVAGGGGGAGLDSDGGPGQATNSGQEGADNGGAGGTDGSGGSGSYGGGGGGYSSAGSDGAGFNGQGDPNRTVSTEGGGGGTSFIDSPYESVGSGIGGEEGGYGGFGGGGGGAGNLEVEETPSFMDINYGAGGGGGGFSGGGAGGVDESNGYYVNGGGGGGGGSYVDASATNVTITAGGAPDTTENSSGDSGSVTFDLLEAACYAGGTRIATVAGEVNVEDLAIGDFVETRHAGLQKIKWIGRRSYDGRFIAGNRNLLPICIKRHAIDENVPARDLWVSPGHAICINGALIHALRLVNAVSIIQVQSVESVTYYHVELQSHEIIFAENCPAESFLGAGFRKKFQNASEFLQLYPGEAATETMCLPRLESGFQLQAIQRRIAARAGIAKPKTPVPGPLRGFVDQAGPKICYGWVQDIFASEEPVCLDITEDGRTIGRVLANLYRADVRAAGYGSGYHGFEFLLPPGNIGRIDVVGTADRAILARPETSVSQAA